MTDVDERPLEFERELDAPPEKVWRAITEPEHAAKWLGTDDLRAEPGAPFSIERDGERVDGRVEEVDAPRRLRVSFREGERTSQVTFTLVPTIHGGTRLRVEHGRFAHVAPRMAA